MRSGTCWHRVRRHEGLLGLLLLVAIGVPCAANECPNEPPLLGGWLALTSAGLYWPTAGVASAA